MLLRMAHLTSVVNDDSNVSAVREFIKTCKKRISARKGSSPAAAEVEPGVDGRDAVQEEQ